MTMNSHNIAALNDAKNTAAHFEQAFGMTTEDMLSCAEEDARLAEIDRFELMDWHFAADVIKALTSISEQYGIDIVGAAGPSGACVFNYAQRHVGELSNSPELEFELVA